MADVAYQDPEIAEPVIERVTQEPLELPVCKDRRRLLYAVRLSTRDGTVDPRAGYWPAQLLPEPGRDKGVPCCKTKKPFLFPLKSGEQRIAQDFHEKPRKNITHFANVRGWLLLDGTLHNQMVFEYRDAAILTGHGPVNKVSLWCPLFDGVADATDPGVFSEHGPYAGVGQTPDATQNGFQNGVSDGRCPKCAGDQKKIERARARVEKMLLRGRDTGQQPVGGGIDEEA